MVVRMPLGARPRAIQTPEYPAPEPISTAAWAPTQLAAKRRNAPDSADTGGIPPPAARSRVWRRTSSSTTVSSARYAAMASAWMATATPLTLARLRSGRFQPNLRSLPAVWDARRLWTGLSRKAAGLDRLGPTPVRGAARGSLRGPNDRPHPPARASPTRAPRTPRAGLGADRSAGRSGAGC